MLRKKQLEITLSKLVPNPKPKVKWEYYALDTTSAAEIMYIAEKMNFDIKDQRVIDLGCGSGILGIAAALLEAKIVAGVDIDKDAIQIAKINAKKVRVDISFISGSLDCIRGHFDTTLMNPPFGSWRRGADVRFLTKALEISNVVYSLHKSNDSIRRFLRKKIPQISGVIDKVYSMQIIISRTYLFHKKSHYPVKVDLYRIVSK